MQLLAYDCELLQIDETICQNVIFVICGFDKGEFNAVRLVSSIFYTVQDLLFKLFRNYKHCFR